MKSIISSIAAISIFFFFSCSNLKKVQNIESEKNLIPLTKDLIQKYKITPQILQRAQFWVGDTIVLERAIATQSSQAGDEGQLILRNDTLYERIIVPYKTMGICLQDSPVNAPKVCFSKDDKKYFEFVPYSSSPGQYVVAQDKTTKLVKYGGMEYRLASGGGSLLVDPKFVGGSDKEIIEPGRKIGQ